MANQYHLYIFGPNTKKLWDTIKYIYNPPKQPDNQSIQFNYKHYNDPQKIANKFNSQYTQGTHQGIPETSASNSKAMGPENILIMMKHLWPKAISYLTNKFDLTPRTLWEDPTAAAAFLGLIVNQGAVDQDDND